MGNRMSKKKRRTKSTNSVPHHPPTEPAVVVTPPASPAPPPPTAAGGDAEHLQVPAEDLHQPEPETENKDKERSKNKDKNKDDDDSSSSSSSSIRSISEREHQSNEIARHICDGAATRDMAVLFDKLARRRDRQMDVLAAQREKLDAKSAALQAEYNALDASWSTYVRSMPILRASELAEAQAQTQDEINVLVSRYAHDGMARASKDVLNPPPGPAGEMFIMTDDAVRAANIVKRLAEKRYLLLKLGDLPVRPDTPVIHEIVKDGGGV